MLKQYISADRLLQDSLQLGLQIAASGFKPDLIVGIWRGGTPVAIAVQEVLEFVGLRCDHIAIRTSSYTGIGERNSVKVHGLDYLQGKLDATTSLLIVDDIFDTGLSIDQVLHEVQALFPEGAPSIRIGMPYYKPLNNRTARVPDYFLHATADWLVFPHELLGLTDLEILHTKPGLQALTPHLLKLRDDLRQQRLAES